MSSSTFNVIPSVCSLPFTSTFILSAVNFDFALSRYLSEPFKIMLAVCLIGAAVAVPTCSQIGSTTSTTVPSPVPPGKSTPEVIVVTTLLLFDVSLVIPSFNATVITPL